MLRLLLEAAGVLLLIWDSALLVVKITHIAAVNDKKKDKKSKVLKEVCACGLCATSHQDRRRLIHFSSKPFKNTTSYSFKILKKSRGFSSVGRARA